GRGRLRPLHALVPHRPGVRAARAARRPRLRRARGPRRSASHARPRRRAPGHRADIRLKTDHFLLFKRPAIYGAGLSWAALSRAIRAAVHGDASALALAHVTDHADADYDTAAVICGDYGSDIQTWADMRRRLELGRRLAPHLQG